MISPATDPGLLSRLPDPPGKVAVLRASRIGDFIGATPALRELAERCPYVDRYAPFPGFPGLAEQLFEARAALRFFQEMQAERFDLALQMQGSGAYSNPFTLLLGAQRTAGFVRLSAEGRGVRLLDAALPLPQSGHEVERVLALPRFLGAPPAGRATTYALRPEDRIQAAELLGNAPQPLIGLHPGAWDQERRWPVSRFAAVGRKLQAHSGGSLVILASEQEKERTEALAGALGESTLDLGGRTRLGSLGAVIEQLSLLLTNDSGPAHIAYALGTPTVTVAHGCQQERYGPAAGGPFILVHPDPPGWEALHHLEVKPVLVAAFGLLQRRHRDV